MKTVRKLCAQVQSRFAAVRPSGLSSMPWHHWMLLAAAAAGRCVSDSFRKILKVNLAESHLTNFARSQQISYTYGMLCMRVVVMSCVYVVMYTLHVHVEIGRQAGRLTAPSPIIKDRMRM